MVASAERLAFAAGQRVPVATCGHLIALKVLAQDEGRSQDKDDIRWLLDAASPTDLGEAKQALALITARGFDRGKNLEAELDRFLTLSQEAKERSRKAGGDAEDDAE